MYIRGFKLTCISKICRYFLSLQRAPEEPEYCGALAEHQGLQEQPADQQCLQRHLVEHCFLQSTQEGSGTALISRRASDSVMITGSQCSRVLQSSLECSGELRNSTTLEECIGVCDTYGLPVLQSAPECSGVLRNHTILKECIRVSDTYRLPVFWSTPECSGVL